MALLGTLHQKQAGALDDRFVTGGVAGRSLAGTSADDETDAWLRRLTAESTPLVDLVRHRAVLLLRMPAAPRDRDLLRGFDRLAIAFIIDPNLPERRLVACDLLGYIDAAADPPAAAQWTIDSLRSIARGR